MNIGLGIWFFIALSLRVDYLQGLYLYCVTLNNISACLHGFLFLYLSSPMAYHPYHHDNSGSSSNSKVFL